MNAYFNVLCDEDRALEGEDYVLPDNSYDPNLLTSSSTESHWEEQESDKYTWNLSAFLPSYEDNTSSGSGNGFENLVN
jgi:hypothetical protein